MTKTKESGCSEKVYVSICFMKFITITVQYNFLKRHMLLLHLGCGTPYLHSQSH